MKTLVTRGLALLLTLALLFTVTPFTALAEAAENEDGMDEIMDILETYEEETEVSVDPGEALTDSEEETVPVEDASEEDQPIEDDSEETAITDEKPETSDLPEMPEEEIILDDPGVEDDWADWYTDDQPEQEAEEAGDDWPEMDDAISEEDAGEDAVQPLTLEEEIAQLYDGSYIKYAIEQAGHAYVTTKGTATKVYETSALEDGEVICAITEKGVILLAFEYAERWNNRSVLVWFLNDAFEAVSGYVREADLEQEIMEDADAAAWMNVLPAAYLSTTAGNFPVFVAPIALPETPEEKAEDSMEGMETSDDPSTEETDDPMLPDEQPEETEALDIPANQPEEEAEPDDPEVAVGTFLSVTTKTRVFSDMDDTLRDDANGDLYMGVFVKDAIVQVDAVRIDSTDRMWYQVAFLYGDDFADGTMKWTEIGLAYVLPEETALTDAEDLTVTDIALLETPKASGRRSLMKAAGTTPMNGFTLKSINAPIPPLYAGQTGVYGSSGHDSDYKQIASLSGKGAIYATPHYLDGYTVYCLEHNLPGPGEGSGSSQQPKGPYVIVDIDTYMNTPGSSRVIYSDQTMHAIAWVLRHTYPFMVLDRSDSDNETWSRVAGQFAIRQVIREMEGAQYVRDYWNMENFYVASGQAPAVYLEYARWLATNGIARGQITGYVSMANKSVDKVGSNYVGTVTLYTDADMIRINRSFGTVSGNTAGSDWNYYYLNSGDTITVTSSTNGFSLVAESVNSDAEEASFLVGVPSAAIQKVLIPQYGAPYAMQSFSMYFEQEIQYGSLTVTKLRSGTQQKLSGAKLQLYDSSKNAYGSPVTTDANGQAQWMNLPYGTYYVGEVGAPAGYRVNVDQVQVTINGNNTTTFNNSPIIGSVSFIKVQEGTEIPLAGAQYELVTKSGSTYKRAVSAVDGSELPVLTTDANGKATWSNVVEYGTYYVHEVKAPEGFLLDNTYHSVSVTQHNKIVSADVEDPIITAKIKIAKTDDLTKEPLAGVEFTITRLSGPAALNGAGVGEVAAVITTDANGYAETDWLDWGRFKVEETKVPAGYFDRKYSAEIEAYENGKTYTINVENEPIKGWIRLEKTGLQLTGFKEKEDRYGNTVMQPIYEEKRLAGAVFEVHAAETITGKDGTVLYEQDALVDTITTTADGPDVSKTLPLGRYYLVEVSAPDGYSFDDRHYEADLIYADDHTPLEETVVTAGNDYLPAEISLTKEKEILQIAQESDAIRQIITTVPGEGFTFGLYNDTDIHYDGGTLMADTLLAVGVTDSEGKLTFSGNLPHGRYFIKELSAPAGWKINTERFTVTLDPAAADEDHVIRVTLPDAVHDELIWYLVTLTKLDITGGKTLPGALIEVSNDKGEVIYRAYTDKNGQIPNIPVTPGTYTFREILAPSGYALNEAVMSFTVDADGGITGDTTIRDNYTRVLLQKQDENGLPLAGVEFALTKSNGTVLMRKTSDADGRIVFEKIPYGEYTITETKALAGYQRHDVSIRLTVDGTFVNSDAPMETIINHPIIVKLKKVDQDGKPLPGAEYALINEFGEQIMAAISDADGMLTFYKVPYGKYTVKELYAPDGYLLSKDTPEIVIDDAWQNSDAPALTLTNHLKRLRYIKVDTSGKYLASVEFSLINASNGEVAEVMTSNEKGEFIFTKFDYGFWLIRETKTPDGYCPMKDITFSVDASWVEPAPFTCINIPNHYEFVKTDNEGNPMAGVKFTLEDQEGNILCDLVSGEDGIVHVDGLTPGTYIIREIETLEGYTVSGETIEVVIDEHYIVPDEMYVLVNYPDIQTGVDFEITPWMYAGGAAMLTGLILLLAVLFRRQKK